MQPPPSPKRDLESARVGTSNLTLADDGITKAGDRSRIRSSAGQHPSNSGDSEASDSEEYSSASSSRKGLLGSQNACLQRIGACLQPPSWYRKMRPRFRQYFWCFFAEIIIAIALLAQFSSFRQSMQRLLLEQASNELHLMDLTYNRKTEEVAYIMKGYAQNPRWITFMKGQGASVNMTQSWVASVMRADLSFQQAEYGYVLFPNKTVLVDMNGNRTGQTYDPYGIVTRLLAHPQRGQLQIAKTISWRELRTTRAPVYRERPTLIADQDYTHPYDTHEDALIRYTATPVWSYVNGTGALLGVLLSGDITNGKTTITYLSTMAFGGGFSGLYTKKSNGHYIRSSSTVYVPDSMPAVRALSAASLDPLTPEFERDVIQKAINSPGETVSVFRRGFAFAVKTAPDGTWNTTTLHDAVPPAVIVRGLCLANNKTFSHLLHTTWYLLLLLLLINIVSVWSSASTFIAPLEDIAAMLKAKQKAGGLQGTSVSMKDISSLNLYAKYIVRVILTLAGAVICATFIALNIKSSLQGLVSQLTVSELGIERVSYYVPADQSYSQIQSYANQKLFRDLIEQPDNTALFNETMAYLVREMKSRKIEFLSMNDRKARLIGVSRADRRYFVSNPSNIVTLALSGSAYKITGVIPYANFMAIRPKTWSKHVMPNVPDSNLLPYATKQAAVIRWVSAPIYGTHNTDKKIPDGVMAAGDLLNANTIACERLLKVTGSGYVAHYAPAVVNGKTVYNLLNSVLLELGTGKASVDIGLSEEELSVVAKSAAKNGEPVLGSATIQGREYTIAATSVPADQLVDPVYGVMTLDTRPLAYVVYGKDKATTKEIEKQQETWIICMALLQVTMMIMLSYVAYGPFIKIVTALEDKGFASRNDRPTIIKVIRVYIIHGTINLFQDMRSRSFGGNVQVYIRDPIARRIRRMRRAWKQMLGHGKKRRTVNNSNATANNTKQRASTVVVSTASVVRTSQVVPTK